MVQVTIGTETKEFPQGTTWAQVAAQYQEQYENDILLVQINGKLQELHKTVRSGMYILSLQRRNQVCLPISAALHCCC